MNIESLDIDKIPDEELYKTLHEFKISHSCNVIDFVCERKKLKEVQQSFNNKKKIRKFR